VGSAGYGNKPNKPALSQQTCAQKNIYREAFNTVFSACCVLVGSGYGIKLGIQKKTRLGHTNFSGTETQFVAQTGWLPVAGEYGDPNHSAR